MYSAALSRFRESENRLFYHSSYKKEVKKVEKVRQEIAEIWKSLGAEDVKLDFSGHTVLSRDKYTRELLGYASIAPKSKDTWFVTQLAVMKAFQRKDNEADIIFTILENAANARVKNVILETDNPTSDFYTSLANDRIQCKIKTGRVAYIVTYTIKNLAESVFQAISGEQNISAYHLIEYFPPKLELKIEDLYEIYYKINNHRDYLKILYQITDRIAFINAKEHVIHELIRSTEDQQMKIDFAISLAKSEYTHPLRGLATFGIEREQDRVRIIKTVIESDGSILDFYKNFKSFGITNTQTLLELAKMAAEYNVELAFSYLDKLDIPGFHQVVFDLFLTKEKVKLEPGVSQYYILASLAKFNGVLAAGWAPYSGITRQETLIRIAELALENNVRTGNFLRKFGIRDEETRLALFKKFDVDFSNVRQFDISESQRIELAKKFPENICFNIKKFNIFSEKDRLEIARCAALQSDQFSSKMPDFEITSEAARIELALIVLDHFPDKLSYHFENFEISNEFIRFEFAKKLIDRLRMDYCFDEYIAKFKISNEVHRFELATLAAERGIFGTRPKEYKITNRDLLLALARVAVPKNPSNVADHIYCYRIEDEKNRIEIAELIAQKRGSNISACIHAFCIHDQAALKRIAVHAAEQDPENTAVHIKKYGLIQEQDRIDIAFATVPYFCRKFQDFEISDDAIIKKLAFLSVEHSVREVIKNITFNKDETRLALAKKCAMYDGKETIEQFNKFKITNKKDILEITWLSLRHSVDIQTGYYFMPKIASLLADLNIKHDITLQLQELKNTYEKYFPAGDLYSAIGEDKQQARWLTFALGSCEIQELSREELDWIAPHMKKILPLSDLQTKFKLVDILARIAKIPEQRTIFDRVVTKNIFASILITPLIAMDVDWVLIEKLNRVQYKELLHIIYECDYSPEEVTRILQHAFNGDARKNLKIIENIIQLGGTSELRQPINDLEAILLKLFRKKIPIKPIENFYEVLTNALKSFKEPELLYTYAGKMNELNDPSALVALSTFVENLLEGRFKEDRYTNSLHLETVFKGREAQFLEWKKGVSRPFIDLNLSNNLKTDFHQKYWNLIDEHKHLDLKRFPYIQSFFDKDPDVLRKLGAAIKDTKKALTPEAYALLFQRHFIRLMKPELKAFEQKAELKMMFEYLKKCEGIHELKSDIENDLKLYDTITHNYEGWTVEDCDDPESLFTCGNVGGSCQRIDGDGKLNKHLLGYVLDGKNRLLCVKDQQGNLIARRIFRILWDAGKQTPVLFMEQVYPSTALPNVRQNIFNLAKDRAAALNLPLTWAKEPYGEAYGGTLESLSSNAPYEYADAATCHQTSGVFSIPNPLK